MPALRGTEILRCHHSLLTSNRKISKTHFSALSHTTQFQNNNTNDPSDISISVRDDSDSYDDEYSSDDDSGSYSESVSDIFDEPPRAVDDDLSEVSSDPDTEDEKDRQRHADAEERKFETVSPAVQNRLYIFLGCGTITFIAIALGVVFVSGV